MAKTNQVIDADLSSLVPDNHNFNKHSEFGLHLLEKSLRTYKFGRSVLVDKNNRVIGGNGVVETAMAIGETKIKIVETKGDELVVVKRTDVDLDSKQGRGLALADNAVAAADLAWDQEEIIKAEKKFRIDAKEWGVRFDKEAKQAEEEMDAETAAKKKYILQIELDDEDAQRLLYLELVKRDYKVQICD